MVLEDQVRYDEALVPLRHALFLGALTLAACAPDAPTEAKRGQPIASGSASSNASVVAVTSSSTGTLCSGALVRADAVLTAAHCARADAGLTVAFGPSAAAPERTVSVRSVRRHPLHRGGAAHDLAVLELSSSVNGVLPVVISSRVPALGAPLLHVGYGAADSSGAGIGVRREGEWPLRQLYPLEFESGGEGQTCPGDSGGPALARADGGGWELVGVVSEGGNCRGASFDVRLDVEARHLSALLGAPIRPCDEDAICAEVGCEGDLECEPDGAPSTVAASCAGGRVAPHPQTGVSQCSRACGPDAGTCVEGMRCGVAGACEAEPLPEVFPPARCEPNTFCRGLCVDEPGQELPRCAQRCAGLGSCPSGELCAAVGDVGVCVPRPKPPDAGVVVDEEPNDAGAPQPDPVPAEDPPVGCQTTPALSPLAALALLAIEARRRTNRG